jgi:hypothetical protein
MSLSIYDPTRGCFILNPSQFPTIINAFHPDYVKTHMPQFLTDVRTSARQEEAGKSVRKYLDKRRETEPSHGTFFGMSDKEASMSPKEMMLKPTEFHTYSKAGMPKGVK